MRKHQAQFVASVALLETVNYPPESVDWEDEECLPGAILEITVTEPRWIAHLQAGMAWESAAYNMERDCHAE